MAVEIANSRKKINFDVVDHWRGDEGTGFVDVDLYKIFVDNMVRGGVIDYISKIISDSSVQAAKLYSDKSLDFVFIDADHKYESVYSDLIAWFPKVKSHKIIAGHDYNQPQVAKAVHEYFDRINLEVKQEGISWVVMPD
jgi:predicted O-methyltransferase YrrM